MAICACVLAISLTAGAIDLPVQYRRQVFSIDDDVVQLHLADARDYSHCHNLPRRTYCHEAQRLPRNWPPNTDTPGTPKETKARGKPHVTDPFRESIEGEMKVLRRELRIGA